MKNVFFYDKIVISDKLDVGVRRYIMGILKNVVNNYIDNKYKTIDDLPSNAVINISDKKKIEETKVLIIDDDELKIEKTLRRIGYSVIWKKDIDVLSDVEDYPFIVCDYKGVGLNFNSEFEGLNLAKLIKEKYPEKIIYLLSAADFNPRVNDYIKYIDELVYKGEENKLIEYIKEDCEKLFNPKERWIHYKNILKSKGINEKEIFRLEDLYVRSFIEKKDKLSSDSLFKKIDLNLNINFNIKIGLINL